MKDPRILVGIALGLLCAIWLGPAGGGSRPPAAALLSDADGAVREFVIQYPAAASAIVGTAYRDFLTWLPANRTVHVVCPAEADFDDLLARVGPTACRLVPVVAGHAMTCWSRDRWLALSRPDGGTTLLTPNEEEGEAVWPARAGDRRTAFDLAGALDTVEAVASPIGFDGGDFAADSETVFVTPRVARRNGSTTAGARESLSRALSRALARRVVLLERAPPYHAGMFMMPVGGGVVLVGEPVPGPVEGSEAPDPAPFEAVAEACRAADYRVVRIPVVPGADGRTWLTFVNVVIDREGEERIVYMPSYRNAPELTDRAERVWRELGFTVRRVDCTETYPHYGSVRCLVSVLSRES